ncbi:MAG TPA: amidohydrolase family protein [Bryobacteraceae bacterium]|nr:amidohydrolase family protein [Bryobacteraceae bacterium]
MKLLGFVLLALTCLPAGAQTGTIVLSDVRLIDGTGATPRDHVSIVIQNGKIARIASGGENRAPDAQTLKLTGKTVIPGLINGHGHLGLTKGTTVSPDNYTAANIEHQLRQYERYGVTTMMSLGMNKDLIYQRRAEQETGQLGGATLLTAGRGIGIPKGVPGVNVGPDQLYRPATPEDARKAVDEMATHNVNLIKIWVDDNLHTMPKPNPAVYSAAIAEAHRHHLKVAAHVYYLADAKLLITNGIDILAHSIRDREIDADTLSEMKRKNIYYIPTLQLEESFFAYADHPAWMDTPFFKNAIGPELAQTLNSDTYRNKIHNDPSTHVHGTAFDTALANLKKVNDAGVPVAFGTDSGANPYRIQGWAEHRELQLMVQAGMTPLQALHSATEVNAKMLQLSDKTGTIAAGKQADLIVLDGDPSSDITNTQKIAMVFHDGKQVKPRPEPQ